MNVKQVDELLGVLNRIALALENTTITSAPGVSAEVPVNPYESPDVPAGFDTVLGYFSKNMPGAFELMDDPIIGTLRDGHWLVKVPAPSSLMEMGINELNAYPVELLEERIR
jgi:hypothetical protein